MGRVPISLFKGDGSFWIVQDSSRDLTTVCCSSVLEGAVDGMVLAL